MRGGFYFKLAKEGIRKNRRLYIPYLLTGTVMVMMSYIIFFLSSSEMLVHMKGGGILRTLLPVGSVVIATFSLMFMFYSSSFLIRQRYREFGLYHVLGMDKGDLNKIIFWENLISAGASIVSGLFFGILLSKLAELIMCNLLLEEITYDFRIDFSSAGKVLILFCGIYLLLFLRSHNKVRRSNSLELLHSANVGERAPKANWMFAVAGIVLLAVAYYIVVSIKQPLTALTWFFVAVLLVIVATYLLFISGSVALCRLLQKNKRYYYKPNHFISVSSMVYRMKRNGTGLASICVLVTIVLVMLSATLSLYIGAEDSLMQLYPKDISIRLLLPGMEYFNEESFDDMRNDVDAIVPEKEYAAEYAGVNIAGLFTEDGLQVDYASHQDFSFSTYENVGYVHIISLEDYNEMMGTNKKLEVDECLLYGFRTEYMQDTFTIENCQTLRVKEILTEMHTSVYATTQIVPTITLVVQNIPSLVEPLVPVHNTWGNDVMEVFWSYEFDLDGDDAAEIEVYNRLWDEIHDIIIKNPDGSSSFNLNSRAAERTTFYGLYAGLFFIGVLLSIIFLFAAVLIIYYKQISEGYEDQKRFSIMQNVGMTKRDISKSINSQVLTVFFTPLLLAGLHLAFAFSILWKLLQLFNFTNLTLMIFVTVGCFLVFALVYGVVYKITSNAYFNIVSASQVE